MAFWGTGWWLGLSATSTDWFRLPLESWQRRGPFSCFSLRLQVATNMGKAFWQQVHGWGLHLEICLKLPPLGPGSEGPSPAPACFCKCPHTIWECTSTVTSLILCFDSCEREREKGGLFPLKKRPITLDYYSSWVLWVFAFSDTSCRFLCSHSYSGSVLANCIAKSWYCSHCKDRIRQNTRLSYSRVHAS